MKIASNINCHEEPTNTKKHKSENQGEKAVETNCAARFIDGSTDSQEGDQYRESTDPDNAPIYGQFYSLYARWIGIPSILN